RTTDARQQTCLHLKLATQPPEAPQSHDPGTIGQRSHASSLVVCTSREDTIGSPDGQWDRPPSRPPSRPPTPTAARAGGRVISSNRCIQIDEEPKIEIL